MQQWNIGVQREIDSNTSAMVAYVGDRGKNLATVVSSPGFGGPASTAIGAVMYFGSSKYDALQMSLRRRESNGLSFLASYTYGNAKNNGPGFYAGNPSRGGSITDTSCVARGTTDCNVGLDSGRADYDARHRFTVAATYALPFMKGNAIAGGWHINTVVTLQTGTPFTVYDGNGNRANMNGDPNNGPQTSNKWFNTSAFSTCTQCVDAHGNHIAGTNGTEPRNAVTGPPTRTVDASLFKQFATPRYGTIELRLEAFNIFNWAQYNQPANVTTDPNFGKITTTRLNSERQIQLGARYIF